MKMSRYGLVSAAFGVAFLVAGCGGGGGGVASTGGSTTNTTPSSPTPSTPTVIQADIPVTVVDGAISKAKVCLDQNRNNACDAGEPTAITDASGKATLKVDQANVGKYPVIAEIGTDATDAVSGPVTTAYVMKAPADKTTVVSPLTTLVQNTVANTGVSSDAAEASLRSQVGVKVSLFTNFTQGSDAESTKLGTLARLVVTTVQAASQQLAPAVGTQAMDGKPIQAPDVQQVIQQKLLEALPNVIATLGDPRLSGATPASQGTIISTLAQELVASPSIGLGTATLSTLVAVARSTETTAETTATATITAGASLSMLSYSDARNWGRRILTSSIAQNTLDANGLMRYVDRRDRSNNSAIAVWSTGGDPSRQDDVHWNGTAWVNCPLNFANTQPPRDAQGRTQYNYCDNLNKGVSVRSAIDVSGRAVNSVYQQIIGAGYKNLSINNAASVLGTATFPSNSKVFFQISTPLAMAPVYNPNLSADLRDTRADVASGNQAACNQITQTTPTASYTTLTTSITGFIAARAGTPCVYNPGTVAITTTSGTTTVASGSRNEWWSQSTADIGTIGNAPVGGIQNAYYTTNTPLRVAFGANQTATYYACQQRSTDGSIRNCNQIGAGSYTVTTLGDAKVLALQNDPALFSSLSYIRIFVERGGKVHHGYVSRLNPSNEARLNLTAANTLASLLGIPATDPESPLVPTAASYQGDWIVSDRLPLDVFSSTSLRFSASGDATTCVDHQKGPFTCTVTLNPATGALTFSAADGKATGTLNFDTGAAAGTFTPTTGSPVTFTGMRR